MTEARNILKKLEGKEIYLLPTGNYARNNKELKRSKLIKVAKVFATIAEYAREEKYRICSWVTNGIVSIESGHNSGYTVFESLERYESHKKLNETKKMIDKFFSGYGDNLGELKESDIYMIASIIEPEETK
jgi:hypothetical protein